MPCCSIPPRPALWRNPQLVWGLLGVGAIGFSLYATGIFQRETFNPGGIPQFVQFFAAILHPDLSTEFLLLTRDAALVTLAYAVCGTFLSILFGLVAGIVCSEVWWLTVFSRRPQQSNQRSTQRLIRSILRIALSIPRAIHELIWGLFFLNLFGLDPLVGILAIAIPYSAIVAKIFSELLDETPRQPLLRGLQINRVPIILEGAERE